MRRALSLLALVLSTFAFARAADERPVLDVWPGTVPGEKVPIGPEKATRDKSRTPITRVTDVSRPTLTVYRPAKDKDTGTAVVICPGGGYNLLAWDLEGQEVAAWLNSVGVTGVILKYRVPRRPGQPQDKPPPGPLQDAQRALSLVRSKAEEWGVNPHRIGILGFSAGGHLATAAATNFDRRAYEPADGIDAVSCRPDFAVLVYPAYLVDKGKDELNPDIRVRKDCPPTFLAHAADDPVPAANSVVLFRELRRAGVSAELHVFASGGHGYGLRPHQHPSDQWPKLCATWMRFQGLLSAAR